jgi:pyridoxamine 5'-phosphate oxidase
MTLATVAADGTPARGSCCKGVMPAASFFTNYRAARAGSRRPAAALLFHWVELERQVRIEGAAGRCRRRVDAYFATRPHPARIGRGFAATA